MQFSIAAVNPAISMTTGPMVTPIKAIGQPMFNPSLDLQIRKYVTEHRKTTDNHEPSTQVTTPFPNASGSVIPTPSRKITVGEPFAVRLVPRKRKQGDSSIESSLNMREELKISREDVEKFFDMPQPDAAVALGISLSTLKNVCRKIGVYRWPYQRQYGGIKQRTSKAWLGADAWMEEALEHVEDQNRFSDFDVPRPKMCCVE